ncbi:unnamed protein product [Zymoseptoria tritici ST99CH_3D7]|uniref:F-box domain-containing protein n=1 Tax=Zymoseptoria tritici (strain ST99CH_3D7) TaxID=1276538 RepID=A0A1X7S4N2_ZYMT9|nr:unnamed protein product [Zymoseptoria tritici ST99CH_3D7]
MPSPSVMPPPSIMGPSKLPPFSQRKVQAARDDLMRQMNDPELDELIKILQNRQRRNRATGISNQTCGLLKLPAELLNTIYEDVAADAHEKVVDANLMDAAGKKVRPGLLGTCHQLYSEFFSVFWSSKYIRCEMFGNQGETVVVKEPHFLFGIPRGLYNVLYLGPRRVLNVDPTRECQTEAFKREVPPVRAFTNNWVGFWRPEHLNGSGMWSKFHVFVVDPESEVVARSLSVRPEDFVEFQGLILKYGKGKGRVI